MNDNLADCCFTQEGWDQVVVPVISDICHGMSIDEAARLNDMDVDTIRTALFVLTNGYAYAFGLKLVPERERALDDYGF